MRGSETEERATIQEAARLLRVSTKTIQRYIAKGLLKKMKEATRTYVLISELKAVRGHPELGQGQDTAEQRQHFQQRHDGDTVTLGRAHYESLLIELGELRKQARTFFEFREILQVTEDAIRDIKGEVLRLSERVQVLEMQTSAGSKESIAEAEDEVPARQNIETESIQPKPQKPWWQK